MAEAVRFASVPKMEKLESEIHHLTADLARKDVELEAWRSGRLQSLGLLLQTDLNGEARQVAAYSLDGMNPQSLDGVIDVLMAEREDDE